MKIALVIAAIVLALIVVVVLSKKRSKPTRELSADEQIILGLAREVYGDHIISEDIGFTDDEAILTLNFRDENVAKMDVNLSRLARKHRDQGLSIPVIKNGLKIK